MKNHTLWGRTYLYSLYKYPLPSKHIGKAEEGNFKANFSFSMSLSTAQSLLQIAVSNYFSTYYETLRLKKIARLRTCARHFFNNLNFFKSRNRKRPSVSLLRILIIHFHKKFPLKICQNDKTSLFRRRVLATAHLWLIRLYYSICITILVEFY